VNMKRRLLRLQAIGDQTSDQIDEEVDKAAMSGMLDLRNVLQLVIDGLDDRTFSE